MRSISYLNSETCVLLRQYLFCSSMIELTSILTSPVDSWQLSQYLKQLSSVWLLLEAVITSTLAADKHLVLIWTHQSTDLVQNWFYKLYFHMLRACTKFECELKTNHRGLSSKIQIDLQRPSSKSLWKLWTVVYLFNKGEAFAW